MKYEQCPCKRLKCERHGDCEACRKHHNTQKRKIRIACERIEAKKHKEEHMDIARK